MSFRWIMRRVRSARSSTVVAGLVATLAASSAHAALDLPSALQGSASATVATVVLVPPMAVFRGSLTPTGLRSNGCHYTTADPAAIRALAAVLTAGDITVNPVYQRPDIREGVYFTLADGSTFSVLVADNSASRLPVMGIAESSNGGQILSASVSAKATLSTSVRAWAQRHGGTGTGNACDLQTSIAEDPKAPAPIPR